MSVSAKRKMIGVGVCAWNAHCRRIVSGMTGCCRRSLGSVAGVSASAGLTDSLGQCGGKRCVVVGSMAAVSTIPRGLRYQGVSDWWDGCHVVRRPRSALVFASRCQRPANEPLFAVTWVIMLASILGRVHFGGRFVDRLGRISQLFLKMGMNCRRFGGRICFVGLICHSAGRHSGCLLYTSRCV